MTRALADRGSAASKAAREDHEFYPTPPEPTIALMRADPWFRQRRRIWEPFVGQGHMAAVLAEHGHDVYGSDITARYDPFEDVAWSMAAGPVDYLTAPVPDCFFADGYRDLLTPEGIVSNPPFSLATQIIRRAVRQVPYVALLLPAVFFHAARSHPTGPRLFEACRPAREYKLTWRPDFHGLGAPMVSLSWFVWDKLHQGPPVWDALVKPSPDAELPNLFED